VLHSNLPSCRYSSSIMQYHITCYVYTMRIAKRRVYVFNDPHRLPTPRLADYGSLRPYHGYPL
jgi:hypothetical protein